jgi:catechol 2,3-dioxygenase-like lactoylglutathione lyase family enzyme
VRILPRYCKLTDAQVLALKFTLSEAQEIIALESGFESWTALRNGLPISLKEPKPLPVAPALNRAMPVVFVSDVKSSALYFRDTLGFVIDFLHGQPPFYASVSRGGACLHLRFVHEPVFVPGIREQEDLLSAFLAVDNVKALFAEYKAAGARFVHPLRKQPWGASAFIVLDPDGNRFCFSG